MLQIVPQSKGSVTLLQLTGQLVYGSESRSLTDEVRRVVAAGALQVVIDLSRVGFMDSGGVGELVASYSTTRRAGGQLVLCGATGMVRDVLRIVRLPTMITLFDCETDAIASFAVVSTTAH